MKSRAMRTNCRFTLGQIPIPRSRQVKNPRYRFFSIEDGMRSGCGKFRSEVLSIYEAETDSRTVWFVDQVPQIDRPIEKKPWYTPDLV